MWGSSNPHIMGSCLMLLTCSHIAAPSYHTHPERGVSSKSSTPLVYSSPPPPRYYPTLLLCTHCTYTSLFLITLTPHSFCHLSYEGFASFILIFAHCPIQTPILSDITLRCTPCCKSSSCSLLTPLRTRRNVKGYNGTRHKYYNPNYNR